MPVFKITVPYSFSIVGEIEVESEDKIEDYISENFCVHFDVCDYSATEFESFDVEGYGFDFSCLSVQKVSD